MAKRILITGSSGLVGTALTAALRSEGLDVLCLDLVERGTAQGDIRDAPLVHTRVALVDGVIHLAAVSRVVAAERDPDGCRATNVSGLRNVLDAAARSERAPWVIFASSREVYGQPAMLPVTEDAPLRPINVYGRSKLEGEHLVAAARQAGLRASTVRLTNVYGSTADHEDRVVPAFARAAATSSDLRLDGPDHTFDFTHIDDVVRGIVALAALLVADAPSPEPIHLASGRATTLAELATLAVQCGRSTSTVRLAAPRDFDVSRFVGDPSRARALLGWQPQVRLEDGVARLVTDFQAQFQGVQAQEGAP